MAQRKIERVAVIGTGTIGMGWAALFLANGLAVGASDPRALRAPRCENASAIYSLSWD